MKSQIFSLHQTPRLLAAAALAGALWAPFTSVGRGGGGIHSAGGGFHGGGFSGGESRSFSGGEGHYSGDVNRSFNDGNYHADVNRNFSATGDHYGNYNVNRNVTGYGTGNYNHLDVNVHNNGYYGYHGYDDGGNFWGGFAAGALTTAAVGTVISTLPEYSEPVVVGGVNYYDADGTYYQQGPNGYTVVNPPVGVTVTELPPGAVQTTVNGVVYYEANGIYYQPEMQNGVTVYQTVAL